jgi:hypothetical protein
MGRRIHWTLAGAALAAAALTAGTVVAVDGHRATTVAVTSDPPSASSASSSSVSPVASTSEVPYPDLSSVAAEVSDAVTAASRGTSVGFVLYDRESGKQLAAVDADTPYYTASVVKLLIAIDEVRSNGGWALPDADAVEDLTDMLEGSNDAIASAFWEQNGGTAIVTRTAALIGL